MGDAAKEHRKGIAQLRAVGGIDKDKGQEDEQIGHHRRRQGRGADEWRPFTTGWCAHFGRRLAIFGALTTGFLAFNRCLYFFDLLHFLGLFFLFGGQRLRRREGDRLRPAHP